MEDGEKIFYRYWEEAGNLVVTETELYRRAIAACCLKYEGELGDEDEGKKNNNKNEETLCKADFVFQNEWVSEPGEDPEGHRRQRIRDANSVPGGGWVVVERQTDRQTESLSSLEHGGGGGSIHLLLQHHRAAPMWRLSSWETCVCALSLVRLWSCGLQPTGTPHPQSSRTPRILQWVVTAFSGDLPQFRIRPVSLESPAFGRWILSYWPEPKKPFLMGTRSEFWLLRSHAWLFSATLRGFWGDSDRHEYRG